MVDKVDDFLQNANCELLIRITMWELGFIKDDVCAFLKLFYRTQKKRNLFSRRGSGLMISERNIHRGCILDHPRRRRSPDFVAFFDRISRRVFPSLWEISLLLSIHIVKKKKISVIFLKNNEGSVHLPASTAATEAPILIRKEHGFDKYERKNPKKIKILSFCV